MVALVSIAALVTGSSATQAKLFFLPDAQPKPNVRFVRRTNRSVRKRKRDWVAQNEKRAGMANDALTSAIGTIRPPAPPPPPKTQNEQTVKLAFLTTQGAPAANLSVVIELLKKDESVTRKDSLKTAADGTVKVKVTAFPTVLRARVVDDRWTIVTPERSILALRGNEGTRIALASSGARAHPLVKDEQKSKQGQKKGQARRPPPQKLIVIRRMVTPPPIQVEPTRVAINIKSVPGADVMLGTQKLGTTSEAGELRAELPVAEYPDEGGLVLQKVANGAISQIAVDLPDRDLYQPVAVEAPALKLTAVENISIPDLKLDGEKPITGDFLEDNLGKPTIVKLDPKAKTPPPLPVVEGTEWWTYPNRSLAFRVRRIRVREGDRGDEMVVERVRLTGAKAGEVCGIKVGASREDMFSTLGRVEPDFSVKEGSTYAYLDGGIVFKEAATGIEWMELRRPVELIKTGVELAPPDGRTALYISTLRGEWPEYARAAEDVRQLLSSVPGLVVVTDRDSADFIVDLELGEYSEKTGKFLGTVPSSVRTDLALRYRLSEAGGEPGEWVNARGFSEANYEREVRDGALLFAAIGIASQLVKDNTLKTVIELTLGISVVSAAENSRKTIVRAKSRIGPLALQSALAQLVDDVARATDVRVGVQEVDTAGCRVTLRAGEASGLHEGDLFEVHNASLPAFPGEVRALKESRTLLRVVSAEENRAVCELVRVDRSVNRKGNEEEKITVLQRQMPDKKRNDDVLRILDASTGLVWAKRVLRLA